MLYSQHMQWYWQHSSHRLKQWEFRLTLHYGNIFKYTFLHLFMELFIWYFGSSWYNYFHEALIIYRVSGEAGGKCVINECKVIVWLPISGIAKCVSKKSLPIMIGLVINRTNYFCVNITLSITKSKVVALFVMTFLLARSLASKHSSFCTSLKRY